MDGENLVLFFLTVRRLANEILFLVITIYFALFTFARGSRSLVTPPWYVRACHRIISSGAIPLNTFHKSCVL